MTYSRFLELFPDNDACLEYLKGKYFADGTACPKCEKASKFHRITGRSAYSCQYCGHHVYPTAGTIFHKSTVSLQLWFYAVYMMSSTRCGVSAKQLEREIGVTYKTAHRMFKQIRTLLSDEGDGPLGGEGEKVEVDETFYGGKLRAAEKREGRSHLRRQYRPNVLGMVERGGRVRARIVPDRSLPTLDKAVKTHVMPSSMLFTDEWHAYKSIGRGFKGGHGRIRHQANVYVDGDTHTNTVEGFFGIFKNSIRGTHHAISVEYLQNYLGEHVFRYNHRHSAQPMFWAMLNRVERDRPASA
jgi:transposase